MPATVAEWELDVRRGPGWLLVKPARPDFQLAESYPLADDLWSLLERHFVYRLVIQCDNVRALNSHLIGQLLVLNRRICQHNGVIRLSGLSAYNKRVLEIHGLVDRFPAYDSLEEAVLGSWPTKPR